MRASAPPATIKRASTSLLPPLTSGWQPVSYTILASGVLAVLATDVDLLGEHQRVNAAFQASTSPNPPSKIAELSSNARACIWTTATGDTWTVGPTFPLETPFPQFDRFEDGRWLVVASRTRDEVNGRVLTPDGKLLHRVMLGDGIEHVATDDNRHVWVGWFDEGVFGNYDWQVAGQEWPPSSNGVACFTSEGDLLPLPAWPSDAGIIADCYALNVIGDGVFVCPYVDFPLVYFRAGETPRWWRSDIAGSKALAIDRNRAILAGGYAKDANRLVLVMLPENGRGEYLIALSTWELPLQKLPPSDDSWRPVWDRPTLLSGRGDTIHLVVDGIWYRWTVGALAEP